jgi:hypothetical protein
MRSLQQDPQATSSILAKSLGSLDAAAQQQCVVALQQLQAEPGAQLSRWVPGCPGI